MSAYILLLFGLALIFIEFFLPGAIMGTFGTILVLASIYLFSTETDSILALLAYIAVVICLLYYLVKMALYRMQKTSSKHTICSNASQEGYVASTYDRKAIGKRAVVIADLKPGGYIMLEGKKLQAISISGYISQGTDVEVVGGQEESLIVKQIQKDNV